MPILPVGTWIAEAADKLAPLVAAQPGVAAIAKPDRILPLFRAAAGKREGFAAAQAPVPPRLFVITVGKGKGVLHPHQGG